MELCVIQPVYVCAIYCVIFSFPFNMTDLLAQWWGWLKLVTQQDSINQTPEKDQGSPVAAKGSAVWRYGRKAQKDRERKNEKRKKRERKRDEKLRERRDKTKIDKNTENNIKDHKDYMQSIVQ